MVFVSDNFFNIMAVMVMYSKQVKISLLHAMEAHRVARG
jgi:hypothetical protein